MKKKFLVLGNAAAKIGAFALALGLVACDDGGSSNGPANNHEDSNISSVESEDDLPNCTESRDGSVSFVDGTKEGFVCKDRKWLHYDMIVDVDENLPSCTGTREGLTAYLYEENRELKCVEGVWGAVGEETGSSSSVFPSSSSSVIPGSSSSVIPSEVEGSSSSVASSSSAKSSSSVASSSSEKSSSSVADKANWAYLNPNIDYGTMTDSRDGQVYKTVTIGTQTWMAENLNYAYKGVKYNYSGYTSDSTSWCYENEASNCDKYGRLYTWAAAVDSVAIYKNYGEECGYGKSCTRFGATALASAPVRGVCPTGWHLPSGADWQMLFENVGGTGTAGSVLKSASGWSRGNGTNSFGFAVLPAGNRYGDGCFYDEGNYADFWSSTEESGGNAVHWNFYYNNGSVNGSWDYENGGFSVRCLKD